MKTLVNNITFFFYVLYSIVLDDWPVLLIYAGVAFLLGLLTGFCLWK